MKKYLKISEFAKLVGSKIQNLRYLDNINVFKPAYLSEGGHRFYTREQINEFISKYDVKGKKNVFYLLIENEDEKAVLIKNIKKFLMEQNLIYSIIVDSYDNINRVKYSKNIAKLTRMISNKEINLLYAFTVDNICNYPCLKMIKDLAKINDVNMRFISRKNYADQ